MRIKTETTVGLFILIAIGAFLFMTFQIGVFRFDRVRYVPYTAYFNDVSGLTKKADIKIAGVRVGWVDTINLAQDGHCVEVRLMVLKEYILHANAHATVRQEGVLGGKFLELIPGDSITPPLKQGGTLALHSRPSVSVDDLMYSFHKIANNVEMVTESLKDTFLNADGALRLKDTIDDFGQAAQKIAHTCQSLDRVLTHNEQYFSSSVKEMALVLQELKDKLPALTDNMIKISQKLNDQAIDQISQAVVTSSESIRKVADQIGDTADTLKDKINPIVDTLSKVGERLHSDFLPRIATSADRLSDCIESTSGCFKNAAEHIDEGIKDARNSVKCINEVAQKINAGQGLLGKVINEECVYSDLCCAVKSIRNALNKVDRITLSIDSHFESMYGLAEKYQFQDSKGYVNLRIFPSEDYFYIAGLTFSQRGFLTRRVLNYNYFDEKNRPLLPSELLAQGQLYGLVARAEILKEKRDSMSLNLQVGKVFNNAAIRFGIFEGSAGLAVDFRVPFRDDRFKWISTLEAFDFRGRNRAFADQRPHLKWLNRVFITPNLYFAFGVDDFISKYNKNAFFGGGIRFTDDDLKYILAKVPFCF